MNLAPHKKTLHLLLVIIAILALAGSAVAQQAVPQQTNQKAPANPLVRVLQAKGILTEEEATMIGAASSPAESEQRLAILLLSKGIITQADYEQTVGAYAGGASVVMTSSNGTTGAQMIPAVYRQPINTPSSGGGQAAAAKPAGPAVIPAVAPIRVFPVDPPKREGLVPDLKLGPVRLKPYGFFKASVVRDSSSPRGNDFPLPGFLGDTGPDAAPEFHIKARAFRIGSNFEWLDPSPHVTVTGRFEADFEGNFTRTDNRNISAIRSNQFSIRLAWARVDYAATDHTSIHALFGQDWTPFGSSTLPNLVETTGLGVGFGTLYERNPQFRFGFTHNFGGSRNFKVQPEVAIVLPAFGNLPGNTLTANLTTGVVSGGIGIDQQLAFGERQGADSGRPEIQGRVAFQFQLDKAQGVAPAQIIFSGMQGRRRATVLAAAVPAAFKATGSPFQFGAKAESSRYGYTAEIQLPTRYATLIAKYYNGEDLRWFFAGQLFSNYNDTFVGGTALPAAQVATALSVDGSSTVAFGCLVPFVAGVCPAGQETVRPQRPVRSQGGFVQLGLPLSRIAGADPTRRNAGWTLYLHYGIDFAKAQDLRRISTTNSQRTKSDVGAVSLWYKLNSWVSFAAEQSYYRTRALACSAVSLPPTVGATGCNPAGTPPQLFTLGTAFRGIPARSEHDNRTEIATIFTF